MTQKGVSGGSAGPAGSLGALRGVGRLLLRVPRPVHIALALAWMAFLWNLSSGSFPQREPGFSWRLGANLAHAPLFGILALFVAAATLRCRAGESWPRVGTLQAALVLGWVGAYGVIDEWHQSRTPGRDPSALDVVTDVVGAACVLWIIVYLGAERADERGLRLRLLTGVLACVGVAAVGTWI